MLDNSLKHLRPASPIVLNNVTCPYCGRFFGDGGVVRNKEHVIGRNFVPRGKLNRQWNLIVWACEPCNGRKADLENDLSAISMQPDAVGKYADSDQTLISEALRKAEKTFSRRTGKPVKVSQEKLTLKMPFASGVSFEFEFTSSPQANSERVYELARLQLMGFFYWITFDEKIRKGGFWVGGFFPVFETVRSDWGNGIMRGFMNAGVGWEPRVLAIGADGFFKIVIRRHPTADCWSWALEWNKKHRVVGFFGDRRAAEEIVRGFPRLEMQSMAEGPDNFLRYHREIALPDDEDKLFYWESVMHDSA